MSDIASEFRRVDSAYAEPTLTLLARPSARATIAILRTLFGTAGDPVPTARLHDQVDELLAQLRRADAPGVPTGNGRDVCLDWMHSQWLYRDPAEHGSEQYRLSSAAQEALRTVDRLTKERHTSLSGHLVAGLVRHLRDFSASVAPSAEAYVRNLEADRARIQAEIDRVAAGGDIARATDDDIVTGFTELQRIVAELPSDFARVVESYKDFRDAEIARFRAHDTTAGEALRTYMARDSHISTATAEGRGFEGALQLLRDQDLLVEVRDHIRTLLEDDRASALLTSAERAEVRTIVRTIEEGITRVLSQRHAVTRDVENYLRSHDVDRDHELAATLRTLEDLMYEWMRTAGPRAKAPIELLPGRVKLAHLKTRLHDPADDRPPEPLTLAPDQPRKEAPTMAELRARGGPSHTALADALAGRITPDGTTPAELFAELPDDLRRPVELVGLLPLIRREGLEPADGTEDIETIRPDGTTRKFAIPSFRGRRTGTTAPSPLDEETP